MSSVKGSNILNRLAFLRDRFGSDATDRLLDSMATGDAAALRPRVLATSWYPFDLYNRIDEAIVALFGDGDLSICEEMGADSARRALSGTYRAFLKDGPGPLLQRLASLHSRFYDEGKQEVTLMGAQRAVIRNTYVPCSTRTNCLVARGFYRTVVEMSGGRAVHVTEGGCSATGSPFCLFNIVWT